MTAAVGWVRPQATSKSTSQQKDLKLDAHKLWPQNFQRIREGYFLDGKNPLRDTFESFPLVLQYVFKRDDAKIATEITPENVNSLHYGLTPLMVACFRRPKDKFDLAEKLLEKKADPHQGNEYGETALMVAACSGGVDATASLLSRNVNINRVIPSSGASALSLSIVNGHFESAALLINHRADIHLSLTADFNYRTPLMLACGFALQTREAVSLTATLLGYKVDIQSTDGNGFSALDYAWSVGKHNTMLLLCEGAKLSEKADKKLREQYWVFINAFQYFPKVMTDIILDYWEIDFNNSWWSRLCYFFNSVL